MKVSDTSGGFENAPAGTHIARCISLIGLGTREQEFQGQKRWRNVVVISWELPYELMSDGRPFVVSGWYTRSLSDKANLRHDLEAWRTKQFTREELKEFEMRNLLDKGCQVIISENEEGKTKLTGVAALPKGSTLPDRVNELKYFDVYELDGDPENATGLGVLSEKFQSLVKDSREWNELMEHGHILSDDERRKGEVEPERAVAAAAGDDDIPF